MVAVKPVTGRQLFLSVPLLTTEQLMGELKVSRPTLYAWRRAGMPYVPLGVRSVRYSLPDVLGWLEERKAASGAAGGHSEGREEAA